ncbi:MAG: hypothetical protein QM817_06915 [Archangium sp.]
MNNRIAVVLAAASLCSCSRGMPEAKPFTGVVISKQPLSFPSTGITVDENGERFAWDTGRGIVSLADPSKVILSKTTIASPGAVEDVVAIPGGFFAVIARNEGRVVRNDGVFYSRFCYLPGSLPRPEQGPVVSQLSRAIAYGGDEGRIYVQPQTFNDAIAVDNQIGQFEMGNDQPLEWQPTPELEDMAGGMVVTSPHRLLLGLGSTLFEYDTGSQVFVRAVDLSNHVTRIDGLAIDKHNNTLLVLDGNAPQVLELAASATAE